MTNADRADGEMDLVVIATLENLMKSLFLASSALVLASATVVPGALAQQYTYKTFQDGSWPATVATDLRPSGQVVGWYGDFYFNFHGFTEQNGTFTTVDYPGARFTQLVAANAGDILGVADNQKGFLLGTNGKFTDVAYPSGRAPYTTIPASLNGDGVVVGYYVNTTVTSANGLFHPNQGFIYNKGAFKTFTVPGSFDTQLNDINDLGAMVGYYDTGNGTPTVGFKYDNGLLTKIAFPGAYSTTPTGINDAGEIVGTYVKQQYGAVSCFVFDGSRYTDFRPPNAFAPGVSHVKNSGQVVGATAINSGSPTVGYVGTPTK